MLADDQLSLFEWMLSQVLMRHLRPKYESVASPFVNYYALRGLRDECSLVLSALAWSGHDPALANQAFDEGSERAFGSTP